MREKLRKLRQYVASGKLHEQLKSEPAVRSSDLLASEILRRHLILRPCCVRDEPDAHTVVLIVGNQSFVIGALPCETRSEAEWMQTMLATGLANMMRELSANH